VAFHTLKSALISAPVLALPDFSKPFLVETDASDIGVGAVLMKGHPIAFVSKALGPRLRGLSTCEKEYIAVLLAIEQWRSYLQYGEFAIAIDQKSFSHLSEQRLHTVWQQKVFTKLLGMDYKIVYKKDVENKVVDALSRKPEPEVDLSCHALLSSQPKWLSEVLDSYAGDSYTQDIMARLAIDKDVGPGFALVNGLLRYNNRIWVGNKAELQLKLLSAFHDSAVGGHSGVPVTYQRIRQLFAWKGLRAAVHNFVQSCVVCQQAKPERCKYPGLLQSLPVPQGAWQIILMDFVEGLPTSGSTNAILVVVDKFTKYGHFLPLHHPLTTALVAKVFLDQVYRLHGKPMSIVTGDRVFTSKFWQELFSLPQVQLRASSAYDPQSNGVIPGFYAKTKYPSYAWPRINCSTHMTKSVHR
jgi:hypothetical protein